MLKRSRDSNPCWWCSILVCLLGIEAQFPCPAADGSGRFVQDTFCIGLWWDPPIDDRANLYYRQLSEANFNVVLGSGRNATPEKIARQLELCGRYRMKALSYHGNRGTEDLPDGPACWGYLLKDEPKASEFAQLGRQVEEIRKTKPGKLAYINLYPSHASAKHLGVPGYEEYVTRFLKEVPVDVLCFDRYPVMNPDADEREGYCDNLGDIRRHALKAGIPFWNFFNIIPYGRHFDPTEAQVVWQVFTSLAYGAKGVLYFCYWTPTGKEFPKGGAIITADGQPTRHYEQARRLNARLRKLGPTLMNLTSTGVLRIKPGETNSAVLAGSPIRSLSDGDYLLGIFRHTDGRRAVLLNNYRCAYTAWPTVTFDVPLEQVEEVDQQTGREVPVRDDSPDMPGLQLSLDAGDGRLFLLPQP